MDATMIQRRPWLRTAGAVLVLLVIVAAIAWWWNRRGFESTDDAQVDGYVYPISARINGQITQVHVQDGQPVTSGSPLVDIDDRDYQVALAKARSEYANADAAASAAGSELGD